MMKQIFILLTVVFSAVLSALPGDMVLESGPYKVHFAQKHFYASSQYFFKGVEIGNRGGFYGTIFASSPNKFVGSGHSEGGKEKIISLRLVCDGKEENVEPKSFNGKKLEFTKISMLNNLRVTAKITITPENIIIDKSFEAVAPQQYYSMYVFQFCWSTALDKWMICRPNGTFGDGVFKSNRGWFLRGKEPEIRYWALYNSKAQKGILGFFSKYFPQQGSYLLWDHTAYHKFYFWAKNPKNLAKGYKSPAYQLVLKGIDAAPDKWLNAVKTQGEILEKRYPMPEPPRKIELFKQGIKLSGNGKFLYRKEQIPLSNAKKYTVSLEIKKSGEVSPKAWHNYVLVGHHDLNRKFRSFATLAARIKADGKWHTQKVTFTTPEKVFESSIIFYNCNSKGDVEIKNVVIEREASK